MLTARLFPTLPLWNLSTLCHALSPLHHSLAQFSIFALQPVSMRNTSIHCFVRVALPHLLELALAQSLLPPAPPKLLKSLWVQRLIQLKEGGELLLARQLELQSEAPWPRQEPNGDQANPVRTKVSGSQKEQRTRKPKRLL